MKEQEKHSPLPWAAQATNPLDPDIWYIRDARATAYSGEVATITEPDSIVGKANAEFIVRAVNSHHQLVEALERFLLMFPCGHAIPTADGCVSCGASLALKAAKEPQS